MTAGVDYTESDYSSGFAPRYKQTDTAGWGLVKLAFFDEKIILNGGIRHDVYTFKVDGNTEDLDNTSLSAGIAFNPWEWLTLRANIGESYKVPSGLYVVGYEGLNGVKGNPSLKPEKGLTRDVGFEARWRGLKAGLTYFATEYRDKILNRGIDDAGYSSEYYNQDGQSFINGLEGSLSFDLGEFNDWEFMLRPYLNFTRASQEHPRADGLFRTEFQPSRMGPGRGSALHLPRFSARIQFQRGLPLSRSAHGRQADRRLFHQQDRL